MYAHIVLGTVLFSQGNSVHKDVQLVLEQGFQ